MIIFIAYKGYVGLFNTVVIKIHPRYFRTTKVENLLSYLAKAKRKLGWVPEINVQEMVTNDLAEAKQHVLLNANEHNVI